MHPILDKLKKDGITKIKLGIFDVDGIMRGKYINMKKFTSALENGFGFCDVVFGWDIVDELYDKPTVTGWHTGYPDAHARARERRRYVHVAAAAHARSPSHPPESG